MVELSYILTQFPYAGLFLLLLLGCIGFPFPEDAVLVTCGLLISQGIIMPLPGFLTVYSGIMLCDFIIYSIGKKYGRAIVTHRMLRRILSREKLHSIEKKFNKFGWLCIVLGRQIIGVRAQTILVSGILDMPRWKFLFVDAVASALTILIMLSLGYIGAKHVIKDPSMLIPGGYVLALILLFMVLFSFIKLRRAKRLMKNDGDITMATEKIS